MWAVFKVSPYSPWINLDADNWIYILQPEDKLVDPEGNPVPFRAGLSWTKVNMVPIRFHNSTGFAVRFELSDFLRTLRRRPFKSYLEG